MQIKKKHRAFRKSGRGITHKYYCRAIRQSDSCFPSTDEHADAFEGGGDVVEPAELRQRLQQQQPPGRHPGLVAGVDLVMPSATRGSNCSHCENSNRTSCHKNPATLIWVQVTQIFKKRKKKSSNLHFRKRATRSFHCTALFFCVCFHRCGPWLLGQEPDLYFRQTEFKKAHSLSLLPRRHLPSSPAVCVLQNTPAGTPPSSTKLQCA